MEQNKFEEANVKLVKDLFQRINFVGNERELARLISEHIKTEHRTLIQKIFRMMAIIIKDYSEHEYFDQRNKDSLDWAKEVAKIPPHMGYY